MFAARRRLQTESVPSPLRRRSEPKSLALLVDVVLARYGILPLDVQNDPAPARRSNERKRQALLFPVS